MAQEFDVLGEGQLQLLGRSFLQRHPQQIVAALQNKKAVYSFPTIEFRQLTLICHPVVARRIHVRNTALAIIESANSADAATNAKRADPAATIAKNMAPIAATPAALAICAVVPYMPEPAPALPGFTVESTALDNGAITSPCP